MCIYALTSWIQDQTAKQRVLSFVKAFKFDQLPPPRVKISALIPLKAAKSSSFIIHLHPCSVLAS
jgi:hypothetical protein